MKRKERHTAESARLRKQLLLHVYSAAHFKKRGFTDAMHESLLRAEEVKQQIRMHESPLLRLLATNWFHPCATVFVWVFIVAVVRIVWTLAN